MKHRIVPGLLLLTLALPVLAPRAQAQPAQAAVDAVLKDFARTGKFLLMVNGKPAPAYEIYQNENLPAYLILSPALPSAVLLTAGTMKVDTVPAGKVIRQKDGTVGLAADADLKPQGQFKLEGDKVLFTSDGRRGSLSPNPPLLGLQKAPALKNHSPEYMVGARGYKPNAQAVAALKKRARPVKVKVFFGSWCPHCKEHLPYLLRVEEELKGAPIQFEYYGLPQRFGNDPEAKKYRVDGVPTGIVFVDGKEVGRISRNDWQSPETRLNSILNGKAGAAK
ncbi:MAG TPA: thioredoxin family protein [Thermoanaerobaculia bacterium]|jgi:thiol-disulfide isomerase/thioredoxin|nr:thioredoxin family protein [Thermoanaerobaculia bacterium]